MLLLISGVVSYACPQASHLYTPSKTSAQTNANVIYKPNTLWLKLLVRADPGAWEVYCSHVVLARGHSRKPGHQKKGPFIICP